MNTVKQLIAILLVLTMVVGLAACGSPSVNESENTAPVTEQKNETVPEATTPSADATEPNNISSETIDDVVEQPTETESSNDQEPQVSEKEEIPTETEKAPSDNEDEPENESVPNVDTNAATPSGEYNEGIVLVKIKESFQKDDLGTLSYTSAEPLYNGSKWYRVELADTSKTADAVTYLTGLNTFAAVDFDYVMSADAKENENPNYNNQTNLGLSNIPHGWTVNGKAPGGSADVVIAVIDTGVDYNHLDLRNNIWVNSAEIPNNGKDDDGNGYIDDVNGWDFVGNDKDPMDDNGHGTHVAGIIAAENNKEGGIGVAYNCKVMVLKAGNSSGYFNNSDIAEAIQYAYMNGASVINMSFGGSQISVAVEEALENAYNSCVLVASAGNDGACNNLACRTCDYVKVCYPAALPYVIGVMSTDKDGKHSSSFSNYDHNPHDSIEYEVYAVGEGVGSTWPSNKYACLNGTSMAAPTVAGIAALLRSYYSDREMYSTKFIQSQIVNTGTVHPHILDHVTDEAHSVADVQEAMTKLPKPAVNLYDYCIDDSTAISTNNNGNGVIDAGETVRLHISLHNRGGVASNVNVTIDTYRSEIGNEALTDPYFTFVNPTMQLSDIGTYSVRESGDQYFEIVVSPDCPNDYLVDFNIRYTYKNGIDEKDTTVYEDDGKQKAQFNVSRGFRLPATITEDTVYTADRLYIVGEDVIIPEGVTVTFEEGCEIQFYDDRAYFKSPCFLVYGTLNFCGTSKYMISLHASSSKELYVCPVYNYGTTYFNYVNVKNLTLVDKIATASSHIYNSHITTSSHAYQYIGGTTKSGTQLKLDLISNSYVEFLCWGSRNDDNKIGTISGCYIIFTPKNAVGFQVLGKLENSIVCSKSGGTQEDALALCGASLVQNNYFTTVSNIKAEIPAYRVDTPVFVGNAFSKIYREYGSQVFPNFYDKMGNPTIDLYGSLLNGLLLWPYAVSIEMFDKDGNPITTIGKEEIKVRVTFNRPMDVNAGTFLTFGTIKPYGDYRIDGAYISDTVWEGTYTLKAQIENGQNFLQVNNAWAAEDPTKTVFGEYQLHEFTIDTTAAMAMNLQAVAKEDGIELTFAQDDYDTLLGYNIYRSTEKDGNYVKLNPTVLLPEENTFLDENAEPGKTYWYTYTVVLSDFTESNPAGKVQATAKDTMAPSLYHTPVNQGYENNNLVISCTASDNVAIETVTLYYRTVGADQWKSLTMSKLNDKYSATIFGSDVTLAGLQYYIVAADAVNSVYKGSAETPYAIIVKSADSLLGKGDVDGNGTVTTKDALMLMQCLNGDLILTDDAFKRADLNGDNVLSSAEALRILQYVNGKLTSLDM